MDAIASQHSVSPAPANAPSMPAYPEYPQAGEGFFNADALRGMFWRQRFVLGGVLLAALLAGLAKTLLTTPTYVATGTVQVDPAANNDLELDRNRLAYGTSDAGQEMRTLSEAVMSRSMAGRVADRLNLANDPSFLPAADEGAPQATPAERKAAAVAMLKGGVKATASDMTRIIRVDFVSPDPVMAARITNAYLDEMTIEDIRRNGEKNRYAQEYLEKQIAQTRDQLAADERGALGYARSNGIVGEALIGRRPIDSETSSVPETITATNLATINEVYSQARADRIAAEQRWRAAAGVAASQLPEVQSNSAFLSLQSQRSTLAAQLADLRTRYGEAHPQVVETQAQIASLDRQIGQIAANVKSTLRQAYETAAGRENGLAQELRKVSGATLDEQDRRVTFNQLDRQAQATRAQLDALLERYNLVASAANVQTGQVTKLDTAIVPTQPFSPDIRKNLLVAAVIGLALAVGLAVALELMDDRLRSANDVETKLGLPLLGITPSVPAGDDALDNSSLDEAYSSIRTALDFALPRRRHNVVQVTSTQSGEGKTTTAISLARKYARLGQSVLLVDGDLRRPSIAQRFGRQRGEIGFVEVLLGSATMEQALLAHDEPNLAILPIGNIPTNPVDVLSSPQLTEFVERQRSAFDMVIIDSPPVVGLADAPLTARLADGTILVVEANRAHFGAAKAALRRLSASNAQMLGVLLTKFTALDAGQNYDYQYTYYAYGEKKKAV